MNRLGEHLELVASTYASRDFATCRLELDKARALAPDDPTVMRWVARLANQVKSWAELLEFATRLLEARPDDPELVQLHARACTRLGRWRDAVTAWEHVVKLRPGWPEGWYALAQAQRRVDGDVDAQPAISELRALGRGKVQALVFGARVALDTDHIALAREFLAELDARDRGLVEMELRRAERLLSSAIILSVLATPADAAQYRARALLMFEDMFQLGLIAEREQRLSGAFANFTVASWLSPDGPLVSRSLQRVREKLLAVANMHMKADDDAFTVSVYRAILKSAPTDLEVLLLLARAQTQVQNWQAASHAWADVVALEPDNVKHRTQYARAIDRSGQLDGTREAWREIKRLHPTNVEADTALSRLPARAIKFARTSISEKDFVGGWRWLSQVPPQCAEYEDAQRRLAQLARYLRKDIREAYKKARYLKIVEAADAVACLHPDDASLMAIVGKAAMRIENFGVAAGAWGRYCALNAQDVPGHLELAKCHLQLGVPRKARDVLTSLLARHPDSAEARDLMNAVESADDSRDAIGENASSPDKDGSAIG